MFSVEGFGTVVTGHAVARRVRTGDVLALLPGGRETRVRRVQVHGATVDEARAGQRTAIALHGVERDQVERGDWLVTPGSLRPSSMLDVRFELLPDSARPWLPNAASASISARARSSAGSCCSRATTLDRRRSALAQLRLEKPTVAARGDRFVIRSYSPSRTVGGGVVIEPVAAKRTRNGRRLEQLAVHETGSLEARMLERLEHETKPAATAALAQQLSASARRTWLAALATLGARERDRSPCPDRWLGLARWRAARARDRARRRRVRREVTRRASASRRASSKSGAQDHARRRAVRRRVRGAGRATGRSSSAASACGRRRARGSRRRRRSPRSRRVEAELEAAGLAVPENAAWQAKLGAAAGEVDALGMFLGRLVRVSQDFTYTAGQMEALRAEARRALREARRR